MSAEQTKIICSANELDSGGTGVKFTLKSGTQQVPAFVIRFDGIVYGYLNRCAHLMLELDWDDAEYFDNSGEYLICSNHGAMFEPHTGLCINGPCYGASLSAITVMEQNETILLDDERFEIV